MYHKRKRWMTRMLALCMILIFCVPVRVFGTAQEQPEIPAAAQEGQPQDGTAQPEAPTPEAPTPEVTPDPVESNQTPGWPPGTEISSDTACLMDADTGAILYNKGMTQKMYPASITKVMTALVALDNASLTDKVVFTQTGVAEAYSGSSNLYTQVGEEFTMEDSLYALLMKSANDFASQIAERVGGSVANFVQMMNDKAAELGCVNTHFNNAHGLPDENHYSCAYDMTLILREAAKNDVFCKITGAQSHTIPATAQIAERSIASHNAMIMPTELFYEGCLGGKTGYTDGAMYTFVSFAERNGRKLVSATMHAPSSADSFVDTRALFDYGFNNFENKTLIEGAQVYDGGAVTLPKGAAAEDVVATTGESFETNFGTMIEEVLTYNNYEVGRVAVTKESYDAALEKERKAEEEKAAAEKKEEEQVSPSLKDLKDLNPEIKPASGELFTVSHLIIGAVSLMILVGVVLIVLTLIRKKKRRRKKRK